MTDREQLLLIRSQTLGLLAQVTAEPKPSYSIDGQQVSWESYLGRLQSLLDWCERRLAADEPFEHITRGVT